ncbi:hypothetical protein OJF2_05880 [Aquisphaera giovannonii]|uniref:Bro-N domain-containing protein n=1 Tax=Aquisphaera giovannonii TaxID=406548 RepID=A0A5B9VVE1_9BACT|nr:BRO family protein [Aquisphaera giovannonii]QEH32119.1 hypothetical protein OJF2_05880 [Aquisphaera giovannonii]
MAETAGKFRGGTVREAEHAGGEVGGPIDTLAFRFDGQDVRVDAEAGGVWFIAADVARPLGYRLAANLTRMLRAHQRGIRLVNTLKGPQKMLAIPGGGLYRAILCDRSKNAERYQDWATDVTLPAIRGTVRYEASSVAIIGTFAATFSCRSPPRAPYRWDRHMCLRRPSRSRTRSEHVARLMPLEHTMISRLPPGITGRSICPGFGGWPRIEPTVEEGKGSRPSLARPVHPGESAGRCDGPRCGTRGEGMSGRPRLRPPELAAGSHEGICRGE